MTTADLAPIADIVLISNTGTQQIITDSLVVPSFSFGRSSSDLTTTCSFAVKGAYDIPLSPPQSLALEYEDVVRFHGLVTNCTITWQGGIPATSIEASDMSYLLSNRLVPFLAADWAAVTGMIGPADFGTMDADDIVIALLDLVGIYHASYITAVTGSPLTSFTPGTSCLNAILQLANALGFVFFLYFTKVSGVYRTNAYFGAFGDIPEGIL